MKNNIKGENCWPRGGEAKKGEERDGVGWGWAHHHELSNNRRISYVLKKEEINTKRRFSRLNSDSGST